MAENGIARACAHCSVYVPNLPDTRTGVCRRGPPHPFLVPGPPNFATPGQPSLRIQSVWPPVAADHWCGQYEPFAVGQAMPIDARLSAEAEGSG